MHSSKDTLPGTPQYTGWFFSLTPPKNHKFFSVSKFRHLELFWWDLLCNLTLRTFRGVPVKKNHPVHIYPPVQWCSLYKSNTDAEMLIWFMYIYALPFETRWPVLQVIDMDHRQSGRGRQYLPSEGRGNLIYCRPFLVARLSLPSHFLQNSNICMKS